MLLIFTPLIKKINSQTELQAKAGLGLVFTVISSIMLLVAVSFRPSLCNIHSSSNLDVSHLGKFRVPVL